MLFLTGAAIMPDISWLIVMLLIAPAISLVAIGITVRGSAKAQTMEEAQQRARILGHVHCACHRSIHRGYHSKLLASFGAGYRFSPARCTAYEGCCREIYL